MQEIRAKQGPKPLKRRTPRRYASPLDKAKGHEVVWRNVAPLFEATREFQGVVYVYAVGEADNGPIKIGVAKDPVGRLREMQTGNPRRLCIEHVLLGDQPIEKLLHEFWEPFAIYAAGASKKPGAAPRTEWFTPASRPQLGPILATAAQKQIDYLRQREPGSDVTAGEMEQLMREAHIEHDFVVKGRDSTVLLARGAGYVISRRSRL